MTGHDPLCPWPALSQHPNHCQCDLIRQVIKRERSRILAEVIIHGLQARGPVTNSQCEPNEEQS